MKFFMTTNPDPNGPPPTEEQYVAVMKLVEEMTRSGHLLDTGVIQVHGSKVSHIDGKFTVTDGPFAESKELIAGFAIVQAATREEALALAERFYEVIGGGTGDVRQMFGPDEDPSAAS